MTNRFKILCAVLSAGALAAQAPAANLLTNGGFEAPDISTVSYLNSGSTAISGWTVALLPSTPGGTQVQLTDNAAYCSVGVCSSQGSQFLDLTGVVGRGGGVRSDGFATVAGATYEVSFDLGAFTVAGQGSFGDVEAILQINGSTVGAFFNKNDLAAPGTDWLRFSHSFTGTGNLMTVGLFSSLDVKSSNLGVGLDDVRVVQTAAAVPEPASWALMIGGFVLAGGALRRRTIMAVQTA